jgi:GDP-4-dehydro-6-deoxy-D-mannose reductase
VGAPLVTGGGGFAGRHLVAHLSATGAAPEAPSSAELDLRDAAAVRAAVRELRPPAVFHLAAQASVGRSWAAPRDTLVDNIELTLNVLEAVRLEQPDAAVVVACSGEVYGPPDSLPVREDAPLRPQNPYAVSKAACDLLAGQYADAHGLRIVRTRAFNHAGPGQSDDFVVASFARQVAEAELAGTGEAVLLTGDTSAARDFTDVRDVARAYAVAATLEPGAYNVCSGRATPIGELVELLRASASVPIRQEVDPARIRRGDVPEIRGSSERLRAATGWAPEIPLERTVGDALADWRERLAAPA